MATTITPQQAAQMLKNGEAILIDVRDGDMFKDEHILYAASLPLDKLSSQQEILAAQSKKIIFQCLKGLKSQEACNVAQQLGDKIYNLEGGIYNWKAAGLPVLTATNKADTHNFLDTSTKCSSQLSIVRQMQICLGIILLVISLLTMAGLQFLGYLVPIIIGIVLIIAGVVGCCPLMKILEKMPWNKA